MEKKAGTKLIDGSDLYYAFLAGAEEIIYNKDELNRINVFPVADGDTGSNLSSTMSSILNESKCSKQVGKTLESISEVSLINARGNSGVIFAQFFNGLYMSLKEKEKITMDDFQKAALNSVDYAYSAVVTPVEGTMLTVIKAWASSLSKCAKKSHDFSDMLKKALVDAKNALKNTTIELEVLKKANVVDSGGKGFVDFIEGVFEFFRDGKKIMMKKIHRNLDTSFLDAHDVNSDINQKYCTEALIEGIDINTNEIKEKLTSFGDSLIVAGNDKKARIHIHTNEPDKVFHILTSYGNIVNQKIDNMHMQYEIAHKRKYDIALVTDSIADLPEQYILEEQINVVPLSLFINENEYYDKITISPENFYDIVDEAEKFPTSSQPPQKSFDNMFSFLSSHYDSIIGVFISNEMSGTYKNAYQSAKKIKEEGFDIEIFDSKLNSGAEGLVVMEVQEMIKKGIDFEEITNTIPKLIKNARIYVSVDDFSYMVRGGRVSPLKGKVAKMFNLKPIVSIDEKGKGIVYDKAFSKKGSVNKMLEVVKKQSEKTGILRYSIVYSNKVKRAEDLKEEAIKIFNKEPDYIMEVSSIVGISAGRGSVALAVLYR